MGARKQKPVAIDKIGGVQIQTSLYGEGLPLRYGTNRGTGNLIWYGNFQAVPHTTKTSAGKGFGKTTSQNTTYTYTASVIMAIGEGSITGVGKVWKGKDQSSLVELGLTLIQGTSGQAPWSFLSGYSVSGNWATESKYGYSTPIIDGGTGEVTGYSTPAFVSQSLGYDTTALLVSSAYDLGESATIPNHSFEFSGLLIKGGGIVDADPKEIVTDFLTEAQHGAGLAAAKLDDLTVYSQYCTALGIFMSPQCEKKQPAATYLQEWLDATNTDPLWSGGKLKLLPRGDSTITGNGKTFTPNLTPIYDLDEDSFTKDQDHGPVRIVRKTPADAYNRVQIKFSNRANSYNDEIVTAEDQDAIERFGLKAAPVVDMGFITESSIAKILAQILLQRSLYQRNEFDFELTGKYALLEPGDLVTLSDPSQNLVRELVRLLRIEEQDEGYSVTAEAMNVGTASATLYVHDNGLRFTQNFNRKPDQPAAPYIFELPSDPTTTGLSLGIAAGKSGGDVLYGGCNVWMSLDGTKYIQVGTINGSSRYGTLRSAITSGSTTIPIAMLSGGQLASATATEANKGITDISLGHEYLSYETATLVSAGNYDLTTLHRGRYDTTAASAASGAKWARLDEAICQVDDLDLSLIGQTIHIKLTSFNSYEGGQNDLADSTDYTYTITGYMEALGKKAQLDKIGEDNWLVPSEKIIIIKDYANIGNEYSTITARAAALGVTTTGYATAKANLDTYLVGLSPAWNDTTQSTSITRTTWNTVWEAYYNTREIVLAENDAAAAAVAAWGGIIGIPTPISDGRVGVGLDTGGNLQTGLSGGGPAIMPIGSILNTMDGTQLSANPEFQGGVSTGYSVYNNAGGSKVTMSIVADITAPNASGYILRVSYDGTGTPNVNPAPEFAGILQGLDVSTSGYSYPGYYAKGTQVAQRVVAKIPLGRALNFTGNSIGTGGTLSSATLMVGTGSYQLYENICTIGTTGLFGTFGHIYISSGANSAFTWDIAKFDQIDITSAARTFMGRGGLFDENGVPRFRIDLLTSDGTAAAIAGQGTFATLSSINSTLADTNNLLRRTAGGLFSGELAADVTSTHTASSISGQGTLATANTAAWTTQVSGRPAELTDGRITAGLDSAGDLNRNIGTGRANSSNILRYTSGGLFSGELAADVTSTHVASSISGQGTGATASTLAAMNATEGAKLSGVADGADAQTVWASIGSTALTIKGNAVTRNAGNGDYNACMVAAGYTGSAFVSKRNNAGVWNIMGLDDDATLYGWATCKWEIEWIPGSANTILNENGTQRGSFGNVIPTTVREVFLAYNGKQILILADGVVVGTYSATVGAGALLYPKVWAYNGGTAETYCRSGPYTDRGLELSGSGYQLGDSVALPANVTFGLIPSLKTAPTISDTDNTGTVTLNIGSAVHVPDSGGTVTFPSGTIAGKAYNTLYYVKRVGVSAANPTGTGWNASTTLTISVGDVYENYYTTRATGGSPSPPPPPPPGGGGYCVATDMWMELEGNQFKQAEIAQYGWSIRILDYDTLNSSKTGKVSGVDFSHMACIRLMTESGGTGIFSIDTPLTLKDGSSIKITEGEGQTIFVGDRRKGDLQERWELIKSIEPVGIKPVAHIHAQGATFAAGENKDFMIYTHNYDKP